MKKGKLLLAFLLFIAPFASAQSNVSLRRPLSPTQPMWLIHIDTWNYADPQKIIDLIPKDIRPYVVMNISLSISHDTTSRFKVVEYGYETAKSWLRTCAENQMWVMIQPASGGYSQFSENDLTVYEEFYRDYPNFIGFNYAEQFWGFDETDPLSPAWKDRIDHFSDLLKLGNQYGGYLVVSWCGNQWGPNINPIAMLKRNAGFAAACKQYSKNYILFEKYTQQSYLSDMESLCLGSYLSGYSGNYGIRYDVTGWSDQNGLNANFTLATGAAPTLEHMMLTGQTVMDGPELIWTQCFKENNATVNTDGYSRRNWATFAQFDNVMVDLFRKILDGTVRIPSRKEVIDRTKVVIISDVASSDNNTTYSSPQTLFEGLYRMDGDGNYELNKTFYKKTGRYPTIPTVYSLDNVPANSFQVKVNRSAYATRWPAISSKTTELNSLFPEEYTGDLFAGRHENGWITYNPFKTGQLAKALIPFKYNTCSQMGLTYSPYTTGIIKEFKDSLTLYLSNFDNAINTALKPDTIRIYGSTTEPTWTLKDRGSHQTSQISKSWSSGILTLALMHNGPLDLVIHCAGTETNRLTTYTPATLESPILPDFYTGPRQYEAEFFNYKNISGIVKSGYSGSIRNYTGQGYLKFGTNSAASIRDTVKVLKSGNYLLKIRYTAAGSSPSMRLLVNGTQKSITFAPTTTESDWAYNIQTIALNTGMNTFQLDNIAGATSINFDHIVLECDNNAGYTFSNDIPTLSPTNPPAELVSVLGGTAGVVTFTDSEGKVGNTLKTYSVGTKHSTGIANLDLFPKTAVDYSIVWKEFGGSMTCKMGALLRGTGNNGSCTYADGMKKGYLFVVEQNIDRTVTIKPSIADTDNLLEKSSYTSLFEVPVGKACWFRATVTGNRIRFECSIDSLNWEGSQATTYSDNRYQCGSTQLVWGMNSSSNNAIIDDLTLLAGSLSVSRFSVPELHVERQAGASVADSIVVSGSGLRHDVSLEAPDFFELSTNPTTGFSRSISLKQTRGVLSGNKIYIRLAAGLSLGTYSGVLKIGSIETQNISVQLSGVVRPKITNRSYTFDLDIAGSSAKTPPAANMTIGAGNGATAGVINYINASSATSKVFKPYSGGLRNATGIANLNLFSRTASDYSVIWKDHIGTTTVDYKTGVLVRGDTTQVGNASTGYVQGIMNGYIFIANTVGTATPQQTKFRIYKSTSTYNSLTMLVEASVNTLMPAVGQSIWYRASVSGNSSPLLTFEYSTDSVNWISSAQTSDATAPFLSGATQLVWGLGSSNLDWNMDNITFQGLESEFRNPVVPSQSQQKIKTSTSALSGFQYNYSEGPSTVQKFTIYGETLSNQVRLVSPEGFELSSEGSNMFSDTLRLIPSYGELSVCTIELRLKAGLSPKDYSGIIGMYNADTLVASISANGKVILDNTAPTDHFRSKTSGYYDQIAVWESSPDRLFWIAAKSLPTSSCSSVTIQGGHSISIRSNVNLSDLVIEPGADLKIQSTAQMTVTTTYSNNGSIELLSDASGTATLLLPSTISGSGTSTIHQLIRENRNWYVSSPVSTSNSSAFRMNLPSDKLYWYDESAGSTAPWKLVADETTPLTPMTGYVFKPTSPVITRFTGSLNNAAVSKTVYRTVGQLKAGFNLIGNPYPSYLDWDKVIKNNIYGTIWYRTTYVTKSNQQALLQVSARSGIYSDQIILYSNPAASDDFDNYDSRKMFNHSAETPELYTEISGTELAINGLKEITYDKEIPLGLSILKKGLNTYSIKATRINNFLTGTQIILTDYGNLDQIRTYDLTAGDSCIFTSDSTKTLQRFTLMFKLSNTYVFDTYNATSGIGIDVSGHEATHRIPPMQAFWVMVSEGASAGSITLNNSMRTHKEVTGLHPDINLRSTKVTNPLIRLEISNNAFKDQAVISFIPQASDEWEDFDSQKMSNQSISIPEICTKVQSKELSINCMSNIPFNTSIPIYIKTGTKGIYRIKASQFSDFEEGVRAVLYDDENKSQPYGIDLSGGEEYLFNSNQMTFDSTRFSLRFESFAVNDDKVDVTSKNVWITASDENDVQVHGLKAEINRIQIFNLLGVLLYDKNVGKSGELHGMHLGKGSYIVTIHQNGSCQAVKYVVQ